MSLPFLNPRKIAAAVVAKQTKDGKTMPAEPEDVVESTELREASADLIKAVVAKDEEAVGRALKAAFEHLDKQPHKEGPHIESED